MSDREASGALPSAPTAGEVGGGDQADWGDEDWRAIAESIPHMVWLSTLDGRSVYFNAMGLDFAGLPFEEITWENLIHPDELDDVTGGWFDAVRAGRPFYADYRLRRHDGTYVWHAVKALPVCDRAGKMVRWLGTATDIDERKQLEAELLAAQRDALQAMNLLATLQDGAPVGFGFVDRDLRVVRINPAIQGFTNLAAEHQEGRTVAEIVPELWAGLEPLYRRVLDAGESVLDLPFTRPGPSPDDPSTEWCASFYPVRVEEEILGVGVVVFDVTNRVRAERLRATVMGQITEGAYTQDRHGRLTYMNHAACRMLGWSEEELRGRSIHDVVHRGRDGTPVDPSQCPVCTPPAQGGGEHAAATFARKDGRRFPVACSSLPLGSATDPGGSSVVFHDLSDPGDGPALVRVLLVADGETGSELTAILSRHNGFDVVSSATTSGSAVDQARHLRPDVVVVDAELSGARWDQIVRRVIADVPGSVVLLLAPDDDEAMTVAAIAAGCAGAVHKGRGYVDLAEAVRMAYRGEAAISPAQLQKVVTAVRAARTAPRAQDLTPREREVLTCLARGLSNHQVAEELGVTLNTVRNHVQHILYKLNAHSRLEAVVLASQEGIVEQLR